jgi:hypothetical protein
MTKISFQNISSTTLFNFTDTYEHLVSNLEKGFYCGDIYEKLPFSNKIGYRVPMVCFCDLPLGQIKEHLVWYGSFGIGIKRDYARENGVNPVWYIHKDNPVIKKAYHSKNRVELASSSILPYLKQFLGYQKNLNKEEHLKKFYDEREWRYVPQEPIYPAELMDKGSHLINEEYVELKKRKTVMPIDLSKIEYIIVDKEENKIKLYKVLDKLSKKSGVRYENLVSSIITCTQIRKDF